ncbi:MAG: hypothetical protein DMF98_17305 [Acidobacteria bacterium]|nr:MAG: hypothetical protein DMF98_17305 [Acidobacteriota bacterium]
MNRRQFLKLGAAPSGAVATS